MGDSAETGPAVERECDAFDASTRAAIAMVRRRGAAQRKSGMSEHVSPSQAIQNHDRVQRYQFERNFYLRMIFEVVEATSSAFKLVPKRGKLIYPSHMGFMSERDSVSESEVVLAGELKKATTMNGRYQSKYVVVTKGKLSWYNSEAHFVKSQSVTGTPSLFEKILSPTTTSSPKHLSLDKDFICRSVMGSKDSLIEVVVPSGQTRYFRAKNDLDRRKWLDAMRRAQVNVVEVNFTNDVTRLSEFHDAMRECHTLDTYVQCLLKLPSCLKIPQAWMNEIVHTYVPITSTILSELKKGRIQVNHYSHSTIPSHQNAVFSVINSMYREMHLILPDLPIIDCLRYIRFVLQQTCRSMVLDVVNQFLSKMFINTRFANLALTNQSEVSSVVYKIHGVKGEETGIRFESSMEIPFKVFGVFDALNDWISITVIHHIDIQIDKMSGLSTVV